MFFSRVAAIVVAPIVVGSFVKAVRHFLAGVVEVVFVFPSSTLRAGPAGSSASVVDVVSRSVLSSVRSSVVVDDAPRSRSQQTQLSFGSPVVAAACARGRRIQ